MRHNAVVDIDWLLVVASSVVGLLVGLTGVGAGALMTPLLIGFFAVPIPVAIATDLLFATITKALGVSIHGRAGRVDWSVTKKLWAGSIPGVLIGSIFLVALVTQDAASWLTWLIVIFVGLTAWTLLRRALGTPKKTVSVSQTQGSTKESHEPKPARGWLAPIGGFGIGMGVSLTSVGAGVLGMALLVRLSPENTPPQRLVATDLLHAIPIALIAGVSYSLSGLVDWSLLITLLIGSLPGVVLGSLLSGKIPARVLNLTLGVILALLAVTLVVS